MPVNESIPYRKYVIYLILGSLLFRCFVAATLELGNDEAYYWLYTQDLQWNYFDHPPVVAVWTRFFTLNNLLEDWVFFLRLGSLVAGAFSTWFIYQAVRIIHSQKAGFAAACLYSASFYSGLTAGVYLMPDAPQMFFWTFCLWMVAKITIDEKSWINWTLFGLSAGLCIMSKVHGVFIWGGLGLFVLLKKRNWLRLPQLYLAALLTVLIISPILFWNIQNDFATYRFHSKRVTFTETTHSDFSFFQEVLHQYIFNNPLNVTLTLIGLFSLFRKKIADYVPLQICAFMGIPLTMTLLVISTFRDTVLIHWSGPAYVSLIPIAAVQLTLFDKKIYYRLLKIATGIYALSLITWVCAVNFYPGTWGSKNEALLGYGDISLDTKGWKEAGKKFKEFYKSEVEKGTIKPATPMTATYWWGAHIEYYFCRPAGIQMIGLGPIDQVHQYHWFNKERLPQVSMNEALCIIPSDDNYVPPAAYYNTIKLIHTISIHRNNKPAHYFRVYKLDGWKGYTQKVIN